MSDASSSETMTRNYKFCLMANLVFVVLMFGASIVMGIFSRQYGIEPTGDAEPSLLASSYLLAMRLSLYVGLPAFLVAIFGMLRFQSWARSLFSFLVLVWGLQIFGFGMFNLPLTWGLSGIFADMSLLTAGAVLGLSYMTSISDLFAESKTAMASEAAGLSVA